MHLDGIKALFAMKTARELASIVEQGLQEQGVDLKLVSSEVVLAIARDIVAKIPSPAESFKREWEDDGLFAIAFTREWEKRRK